MKLFSHLPSFCNISCCRNSVASSRVSPIQHIRSFTFALPIACEVCQRSGSSDPPPREVLLRRRLLDEMTPMERERQAYVQQDCFITRYE